jgi:hypothetical protein
MSTSFVTVKFSSSNDEVRRISLPTTTTFQQLHEKLKELFNHSFNVSETLIQYFDEEGDLITGLFVSVSSSATLSCVIVLIDRTLQ